MKKLIVTLGLLAAGALPLAAYADTDVHIGIGLGYPLYIEPEPVYIERHYYPRYYSPWARVYHHHDYHRGHYRHHHKHHKHHKRHGHHKRHRHWD